MSDKEVKANNESKNKRTLNVKKFLVKLKQPKYLALILILVIAILPSIYFYNKSRSAEQRLNDPNTANQKVIDEVVKKVGKHILLPDSEQPTLATVSDVTKVKGQPFFASAKNGDKILVFTQARKAILYRPSQDIIIEVAPLNIDPNQLEVTQ